MRGKCLEFFFLIPRGFQFQTDYNSDFHFVTSSAISGQTPHSKTTQRDGSPFYPKLVADRDLECQIASVAFAAASFQQAECQQEDVRKN